MGDRRGPLMRGALLALACLVLAACDAPVPAPAPEPDPDVPADVEGVEGGAGGAEAGTGADRLTGLPGIDQAQDLKITILDARGTGRLGGQPIPTGLSSVPLGEWLLGDDGSEYEITLRSSLVSEGIVRLSSGAAWMIEQPVEGQLPRFRVFGGQAAFYLTKLPQGRVTVLTPAGVLITRGAAFTVTVSPDFQVLVTCREGSVYLTGTQNAGIVPGQVLVADRLGRGRMYAMTPNEALVFANRWLRVATEEAGAVNVRLLPWRLTKWKSAADPEDQRLVALWFREARSVLGAQVPGPEVWSRALGPIAANPWVPLPAGPSLLGETP